MLSDVAALFAKSSVVLSTLLFILASKSIRSKLNWKLFQKYVPTRSKVVVRRTAFVERKRKIRRKGFKCDSELQNIYKKIEAFDKIYRNKWVLWTQNISNNINIRFLKCWNKIKVAFIISIEFASIFKKALNATMCKKKCCMDSLFSKIFYKELKKDKPVFHCNKFSKQRWFFYSVNFS